MVVNLKPIRSCLLLVFNPSVWWPRAAISNFLDNTRKCNFCTRLVLKLLHFVFIKKTLKMCSLFFKHNLFLKRLNAFEFLKYYKLFLKIEYYRSIRFHNRNTSFLFSFVFSFVCFVCLSVRFSCCFLFS